MRRRWIKYVVKKFKKLNIVNAWTGKFKIDVGQILKCQNVKIEMLSKDIVMQNSLRDSKMMDSPRGVKKVNTKKDVGLFEFS